MAMLRLLSLIKRFRSDERGAFLALFGLMAVVLVATSGAVVDFVLVEQVRTRAQVALDAAALALQPRIHDSNYSISQIKTTAQNLLIERLGDTSVVAVVETANKDTTKGSLQLLAKMTVPLYFVQLVGVKTMEVRIASTATHGTQDIEVAIALDITGSMSGTKISDLRTAATDLVDIIVQDVQTPTYTKMALVPYANSVNVGSYADQVRGPIPAAKGITQAAWQTGSTRSISAVTRATPARITTSANHGFTTGDTVYVSGISGMTELNDNRFTITVTSNTRFTLDGVNSSNYAQYTSGGTVKKCLTSSCEVVLTSSGHGFSNNQYIYITGVSGMIEINNRIFAVADSAATTFTLSGSDGPNTSSYTSGGSAYCTNSGCRYHLFQTQTGGWNFFEVTTCVTERTTANQYTDAAPSTTLLGRHYPPSSNPCIEDTIVPLSTNKTALKAAIANLDDGGSTGGHIGLAWAWYMVSPQFAYLWPTASRPAAYGTANLLKVVILMTDGAFNSVYCNGVISQDSLTGSGSASDHINCDAPNGSAYSQGNAQCTAMKAAGIVVYTVGFDIEDQANAKDLMANCASSPSHAYLADNGTELRDAFREIGENISNLRLSQ